MRYAGRSVPAAGTAIMTAVALLAALIAVRPAQGQTYRVLHAFTGGADGASPQSSLIRDKAGNLYGTATFGGQPSACFGTGCGVAFKLDASRKEAVLYTFGTGIADGVYPSAGLTRGPVGKLYGTAASGGAFNRGVVYRLDQAGKETVLYSFTGGSDGAAPSSGVVPDAAGNLYGSTYSGGNLSQCQRIGCGVAYKLDPAGRETALHVFTGGADGEHPTFGLIRDAAGNLYGTTAYGGLSGCGGSGCGIVFKLDPAGKETVLYKFTGQRDGGVPFAGLIREVAGHLYGTTSQGGDLSGCSGVGCGVVFRLDREGKETVLYRFTGGADGASPQAPLIRDAAGNLYGATAYGGDLRHCSGLGCGVIFRLDPAGAATVLYTFTGGADGGIPLGGVGRDAAGNLYGSAELFGAFGYGVLFKLTP